MAAQSATSFEPWCGLNNVVMSVKFVTCGKASRVAANLEALLDMARMEFLVN